MNHLLNKELEQYVKDISSSIKSDLATWYGGSSPLGKRISNNIWIHSSQMTNSPLKQLLGLLDDDSDFIEDIVIRFSSSFEDLSILHYPGFLQMAHPSLCCSVFANLDSALFDDRDNRSHQMLVRAHPARHAVHDDADAVCRDVTHC